MDSIVSVGLRYSRRDRELKVWDTDLRGMEREREREKREREREILRERD